MVAVSKLRRPHLTSRYVDRADHSTAQLAPADRSVSEIVRSVIHSNDSHAKSRQVDIVLTLQNG
jgi:hypothetical protein